jgi:hypothetical protein
MRKIPNIPKREAHLRDIGLASLGIAIPTLLSTLATSLSIVTKLPAWINTVSLIVGVGTLVAGIICLYFDRKMGEIASNTVEEVLQDMSEVYERSVRTEETTVATAYAPKNDTSHHLKEPS